MHSSHLFAFVRPVRHQVRPIASGRRAGLPLVVARSSLDDHKDRVYGVHDKYSDPRSNTTRLMHNQKQALVFDETAGFFASEDATPPEVWPRLRSIVQAAKLKPESRVLDVGTGCGVLIKLMEEEAGVGQANVTGVDVSRLMIEQSRQRYPEAEFWVGDIIDFPKHLSSTGRSRGAGGGWYDAAFCNAMFGNVFDQGATLTALGEALAKGGRVVISHPLGASFVDELRARSPTVVLRGLPKTAQELAGLARHSFLQVESFLSEESLYIAVLKRTAHRPLSRALYFRGKVAQGYGRGSRKLGIPTANLPESLFQTALADVPTGVYLGWAAVGQQTGRRSYKAVVNVGYSPTFVGEENREKIIEAHLIDSDFTSDFYGQEMRLLLLGFQRPELRFPSFPALVAAINQDVVDARQALDEDIYDDPRFRRLVEGEEADDTAKDESTHFSLPFDQD